MDDVRVRFVRTCPACNGVGFVTNPVWGKFWQAWVDAGSTQRWLELNGRRMLRDLTCGTEIPSDHTACRTCHGKQTIEQDVSREEARRMLGYPERREAVSERVE